MYVTNRTPSTFRTFAEKIIVRDKKGNIFYFHPNSEKCLTFNLPKGSYHINADCKRLDCFLPYELFELPPYEHDYSDVQPKIKIEDNPCKATFQPYAKRIVLDTNLSKVEYRPALIFVLGHETGHKHYENEHYCDLFSANYMLLNGFNPSQIQLSAKMLFNKTLDRKNFVDGILSQQRNFRR